MASHDRFVHGWTFGLALAVIGLLLSLTGCVTPEKVRDEGEARADAIEENVDEDPVEVHADLASLAMSTHRAGHLNIRELDPAKMRVIIRPQSALDEGDFVYRLWYNEANGTFWLEETTLGDRHARWYGPISQTNPKIEDMLPEDYKTLEELEELRKQEAEQNPADPADPA